MQAYMINCDYRGFSLYTLSPTPNSALKQPTAGILRNIFLYSQLVKYRVSELQNEENLNTVRISYDIVDVSKCYISSNYYDGLTMNATNTTVIENDIGIKLAMEAIATEIMETPEDRIILFFHGNSSSLLSSTIDICNMGSLNYMHKNIEYKCFIGSTHRHAFNRWNIYISSSIPRLGKESGKIILENVCTIPKREAADVIINYLRSQQDIANGLNMDLSSYTVRANNIELTTLTMLQNNLYNYSK